MSPARHAASAAPAPSNVRSTNGSVRNVSRTAVPALLELSSVIELDIRMLVEEWIASPARITGGADDVNACHAFLASRLAELASG